MASPEERDANGLPGLESHNDKMRDEYDTGLDKVGPKWEGREDDEDAIDAAGRTAYYEVDDEEAP